MKSTAFAEKRLILSLCTVCVINFAVLSDLQGKPSQKPGLAVEKAGTRLAYMTHNGTPLLAFGCHFEHMFFDDYDNIYYDICHEPFIHAMKPDEFEKDALIIRDFWNQLVDYPNLDFQGAVSEGPGSVHMVLSSQKEAVVYFSSRPGIEKEHFPARQVRLENLLLNDDGCKVEVWKPTAPGGIIRQDSCRSVNGKVTIELPGFVDDLVLHIISENNEGQPRENAK